MRIVDVTKFENDDDKARAIFESFIQDSLFECGLNSDDYEKVAPREYLLKRSACKNTMLHKLARGIETTGIGYLAQNEYQKNSDEYAATIIIHNMYDYMNTEQFRNRISKYAEAMDLVVQANYHTVELAQEEAEKNKKITAQIRRIFEV
jgi:CRISPR/Cas system-associated endoribonuclease Cas2